MIPSASLEPMALAIAGLYVAAGAAAALLLARKGYAPAVALGAIVCWPLFVPLLRRAPEQRVAGPLCDRILATMQALREAMHDPAAAGLHLPEDVDLLGDQLHRADERLAMVDRLLASTADEAAQRAPGVAQGLAQLQRARAATALEIEAVLDGVVQLRLQIGLRSLAGNSFPVQERLRDLRSRLAAIDELAAMDLHA